jgi:hypothetical protein
MPNDCVASIPQDERLKSIAHPITDRRLPKLNKLWPLRVRLYDYTLSLPG